MSEVKKGKKAGNKENPYVNASYHGHYLLSYRVDRYLPIECVVIIYLDIYGYSIIPFDFNLSASPSVLSYRLHLSPLHWQPSSLRQSPSLARPAATPSTPARTSTIGSLSFGRGW